PDFSLFPTRRTSDLWQSMALYLSRSVKLPGSEKPARPDRPKFQPPPVTGEWKLPADIGRRYAAVSGDRNPIHLSNITAKALGMPGAIAHGMYAAGRMLDRKSTRLNSSHVSISYAVFCLKKKILRDSTLCLLTPPPPAPTLCPLSLHDALPICRLSQVSGSYPPTLAAVMLPCQATGIRSTCPTSQPKH